MWKNFCWFVYVYCDVDDGLCFSYLSLRAKAIRLRGSGPYDDRFGPTMLCIFLLVAVVVNFILRIRA